VKAPGFAPTGIWFDNIEKRYGGLYALRRVSLEIGAGECVALAGRNGSGKTTLLRIAARLVRPSDGSVRFFGRSGSAAPARDSQVNPQSKASGSAETPIGFVAHATMVYDELTAEENLLLFARLQGSRDPGARVAALLEEVGLFVRAIAGNGGAGIARRSVARGSRTLGAARLSGAHIFAWHAAARGHCAGAAE
jgi:ABC-type multidrug transport system ATPase subunit